MNSNGTPTSPKSDPNQHKQMRQRQVYPACKSRPSSTPTLVRYTEGGRELDRAVKQLVQCIEEDRACRLGEQKMDLLYHFLRELSAEVEKDKGISSKALQKC